MTYLADRAYLLGSVSFGQRNCSDFTVPGVYSNTLGHLDWIRLVTGIEDRDTGICKGKNCKTLYFIQLLGQNNVIKLSVIYNINIYDCLCTHPPMDMSMLFFT